MMRRLAVAVALLSALAGCGSRSGGPGESELPAGAEARPGRELKLELPSYPQERDLVEFTPGPPRGHRLYVDAKTLTIGRDGIVRFAVVMKTSGGATNVTYEGMRCAGREKRLYALGNAKKEWVEAKRSDWEPIRAGQNEYQAFLYSEYFCPDGAVLPDRETALRALRSGRRDSESRGSHL